jgi:hypothetical protein
MAGTQKFRAWLEQSRIGYVVAAACSQAVPADAGTSRADVLAARAPDQAWKRRSCGAGANGPRCSTGRLLRCQTLRTASLPGWSRQLLVRRSLTGNSKGEHDLACYLCAGPPGTTDDDLVRVAGSRWATGECSQAAKTETSTRSAATTPGTGTSPSPCWRTLTCPSRRRPPQKPWQRPHPAAHSPGLVPLAQTPPAPRPNKPLPAKTGQLL